MEQSWQAMAVGENIPATLCFGDVGLALPASCPIPMVTTLITLGTRSAARLASRLSRELRPLPSYKPLGTLKAMQSLFVIIMVLHPALTKALTMCLLPMGSFGTPSIVPGSKGLRRALVSWRLSG